MMDEYRKQAKFMDRKASWLRTKQVLALLDNLEKVAPPDWSDWFRAEWPAVLSELDTQQKEEKEELEAIDKAIAHTMAAQETASRMRAASAAQKKNRLKRQAEEEAARLAAEQAAQREKLRIEKEEQQAAERAAAEAQKARDEAARLQRVNEMRDKELARARHFQEEAEAIAKGEGIALPESPEPPALEPQPEPEGDGRVAFTGSALRGGTTIGASNTPAAPTGGQRPRGFSDASGELAPGQPPPPSTPYEPGSPGYGEEAMYQRERYEDARRTTSPSPPTHLVSSPRWALTGGGEGQRVNYSSHLGPVTSPTRVGGLGAEPRTPLQHTLSRSDSSPAGDDSSGRGAPLTGSMAGLYVSEVELIAPQPAARSSSGGGEDEVDVMGVDGRRRAGLSLSPRTDSSSSVLRSAPLDVQTDRTASNLASNPGFPPRLSALGGSYQHQVPLVGGSYHRTSSPARSAASLISVGSPVRQPPPPPPPLLLHAAASLRIGTTVALLFL